MSAPDLGQAAREAALLKRWPHRTEQIHHLLALLGRPLDTPCRLLVCGPSGSGKTGVVRDALSHAGAPNAWVSCLSCHSPRLVFDAVLDQLDSDGSAAGTSSAEEHTAGRRMTRSSRLSGAAEGGGNEVPGGELDARAVRPCTTLHDFVDRVRAIATRTAPRALYLVLDDAQRLADKKWGGPGAAASVPVGSPPGAALLSALTRMHELTRCSNVGLVLLSTAPPTAFRDGGGGASAPGVSACLVLNFPAYDTTNALVDVLCAHAPPPAAPGAGEEGLSPALWREFVSKMLTVYGGTCRGVHELRALLAHVWKHYTAPIAGMRAAGQPIKGAVLYTRLVHPAAPAATSLARGPHVVNAVKPLHLSLAVPLSAGAIALADKNPMWPVAVNDSFGIAAGGAGPSSNQHRLEFDLPCKSKFLLLAAYVAANTPAAGDTAAFRDAYGGVAPVGGSRRAKRARTAGDDTHEAVAAGGPRVGGTSAAGAGAQQGPCSFALERVLAIFQAMVTQHSAEDGDGEEGGEEEDGGGAATEEVEDEPLQDAWAGYGVPVSLADQNAPVAPQSAAAPRSAVQRVSLDDELGAAGDCPGPSTAPRLPAQQPEQRRRRRRRQRNGGAVFTGVLLSDVFQQITSLCEFGLLARVSTDPLEAPRYRCAVTEGLARQLAANASVPLDKYLLQRAR